MEENFNEDLGDNIVILNDEDGNEVKFEFLDLIDFEDEEYIVLLPMTEEGEEEEGEVVILKVEDTLNKVFQIFKERFKDDFDFVDE